MTAVRIKTHTFDVDAIIFDKDGTLIDLHVLWAGLARQWIDAIAANGPDANARATALDRTLGLDRARERVVADSPLAVGTMQQAATALAVVLYQHGVPWTTAEQRVAAAMPRLNTLPATLIRPLGDVAGALRALRSAGLRLAVATSDNRAPTLATLDLLGVAAFIDVVVAGDDPLPNKPDGAVVAHIAAALGVAPERTLMVGDSVGDMITGRNGRVAGCVAVVADPPRQIAVAAAADVVVHTVAELIPEPQ